MGKNKDLEFFKKKVKEKNPELYLKSCINTVTCSTEKVFRSNAYAPYGTQNATFFQKSGILSTVGC